MPDQLYDTDAASVAPFSGVTDAQRDALDPTVRPLVYGAFYSSKDETGTTVVSYSFPGVDSSFPGYASGTEAFIGVEAFTDAQKEGMRDVMRMLESVANLKLVEVPDADDLAGSLRIAWTKGPNPYGAAQSTGWSYFPKNSVKAGDVWLHSETLSASSAVFSAKHELGHGLGLKHPFDALPQNPFTLSTTLDSWDYTVMSYTSTREFNGATSVDLGPQTFMWLDILALQAIYGPNETHAQGDTTYDFNTGRHYLTLWDTGGVDTIDVAASTKNLMLDLTPGSWLNVGTVVTYSNNGQTVGTKNATVYVPPTVTLENAKAGSGNDLLKGNSAANTLIGGAGADTVFGGAGNDHLWAGAGDVSADHYYGEDGNDVVGVGAGDDFAAGGAGADTIYGGLGNDLLLAGSWTDSNGDALYTEGEFLLSSTENELLWGGSGDDTIISSNGADTIGGGLGDDDIRAGGGADVIYGGKGTDDVGPNDTIDGGGGNDTIYGGAGADEILGGAGDDLIFNGAGVDTVSGGLGKDTIWGGGGDDLLSGGADRDVFVFTADSGQDRILDFAVAEDVLDLSAGGFTSLEDVKNNAEQVGQHVQITIGQAGLFIEGTNISDLIDTNVVI